MRLQRKPRIAVDIQWYLASHEARANNRKLVEFPFEDTGEATRCGRCDPVPRGNHIGTYLAIEGMYEHRNHARDPIQVPKLELRSPMKQERGAV